MSLSDKITTNDYYDYTNEIMTDGEEVVSVEDLREAIAKEEELLDLYERGHITWKELRLQRDKILGKELTEQEKSG